jgi:protein TonB
MVAVRIALRTTSLATRGAALSVSFAAHAAVFVSMAGHPSRMAPKLADESSVEIEVSSDAPPPDPEKEAESKPEPALAPARMHTHPYPVPPSHDWTPHDPSLVHALAAPFPAAAVPSPTPVEAAAPAMTAAENMPRFTIAIGPGSTAARGVRVAAAGGDAPGDDAPAPEQSVSAPARLLRGVTPSYPLDARAQGVEADVPMELVVSRAGAVESARVLSHAGFGFDEAALAAIRGYRFSPASRDGRVTSVRMRWTMQFRLR